MSTTPEMLPILSRGKHRRPSKGACLMEYVSFLAGERWSDHPTCTHPLLGSLSRLVNDVASSEGRQQIALIAPTLIGLNSDDPRWYPLIARRAALTVLPVAAEHHQRTLCVGIQVCDRMLGETRGGRIASDTVPMAWKWAIEFAAGHHVPAAAFQSRGAPAIVRTAVIAGYHAVVSDRDALLRALLEDAVAEVAAQQHPEQIDRPQLATTPA